MAQSFEEGTTFNHERHCDRYRPIYYASASGDFNPIHIDPVVGEKAGLGGAILQGMCTMAWAAEAVVNHFGDPGRLKKLHVRFSRPVALEDTVRFEGRISQRAGDRAVGELSAKNQRGEDVLKAATFEVSVD